MHKTLSLQLFFCLFFAKISCVSGQFIVNQDAFQYNDSCWTLTPDAENKVGSIWHPDKINLNSSFRVIMDLYFGCRNGGGADGIFFGFQPFSTSVGQSGGGIGFMGVSPSIGIEFDTWQNENLGDPIYDHVAIIKNGDLNHSGIGNLAGPVTAKANSSNIEDCEWHTIQVIWDAPTQTLEVWFDCNQRLSYTGNIVQDIFGGDPWVYWGFTAATGSAQNLQQVCYRYTTFLQGFEDVVICAGGKAQLEVSGGLVYEWSPVEGLSNPKIPNPIASPEKTTLYMVTVKDHCNQFFYDSLTVFVSADSLTFFLGNDTLLCKNTPLLLDATPKEQKPIAFLWQGGQNTPTLDVTQSGRYAVTVTLVGNCQTEDEIYVKFLSYPYAEVPESVVFCTGQSVLIDASFPIEQTYLWQDGTENPEFVVKNSGAYSLTVSNICGTERYAFEAIEQPCSQVYFPNIFSPNGDGNNDYFQPYDAGDVVQFHFFRVFDRWGSLVFEAKELPPRDPKLVWNGKIGSQEAPNGVYVWIAEVAFPQGKILRFSGDVALMR